MLKAHSMDPDALEERKEAWIEEKKDFEWVWICVVQQ